LEEDQTIELPKLPYGLDVLQPDISKTTLEFNHVKHHKAYVDNTDELFAGANLDARSHLGLRRCLGSPAPKRSSPPNSLWSDARFILASAIAAHPSSRIFTSARPPLARGLLIAVSPEVEVNDPRFAQVTVFLRLSSTMPARMFVPPTSTA
jgi:hypothetical protein